MRKIVLYIIILLISGNIIKAQNYNNIVNYHFNSTPTHGVKIKTNLPFTSLSQMPTIKIEGYNYSGIQENAASLNLNLSWYIYNDNFYSPTASSFGGTAPDIWLSNENGKVVIFLNQRIFYQRFTVSAYAKGMSGELAAYFSGWTVVDEARAGTQQTKVPYKNVFGGNVGIGIENPIYKLDIKGDLRTNGNIYLGNDNLITARINDNFIHNNKTMGHYSIQWVSDLWNTGASTLWQSGAGGIKFFTGGKSRISIHGNGNVGIGTTNPQHMLEVAGTIRAREVKIEVTAGADYVFDNSYDLKHLSEVETFVRENKHLPEIPSEKQMQQDGLSVNEFQIKLLQKIEELTLYIIEQEKRIKQLETIIKDNL